MRLRNWMKFGIATTVMLACAGALLLVSGWGSAIAAQISSVFVANGPSNPVPVSFNNSPVAPLDTRGADEVAAQLVSVTESFDLPAEVCCLNDGSRLLYTVPAGKLLVVQYVSVNGFAVTGTKIGAIIENSGCGARCPLVSIPLQNQGTIGSQCCVPTTDRWRGSELVRAVFPPGPVHAKGEKSERTDASFWVYLSGYLIDE
jgi:hypothetical protein